jgi:hypothetical protein
MHRILFTTGALILTAMLGMDTPLSPPGIQGTVQEVRTDGAGPIGDKPLPSKNILVGAIRWDAWTGDADPIGRAVARHLSAEKWYYRLPFFATVQSNDSVSINGLSQEIMDREIRYASGALDYWAIMYYSGNMGKARELYLSSNIRDKINFCLIIEATRMMFQWKGFYETLSRSLDEPSYQTVLDNRPLIYLFRPINPIEREAADWQQLNEKLGAMRDLSREKGYSDPYFVVMDYSKDRIDSAMIHLKADAVCCYAVYSGRPEEPFPELAGITERRWEEYTCTGYRIVPFLSAGWDPRPRWNVTPPWGYYDYGPNWTLPATPEQIAEHLARACRWIEEYPEKAPSGAVIFYAWNEHDEGGWLCPTLTPEGKADDSRLRAMQKIRSQKR